MDVDKLFGVDEKKASDGIWVEIGDGGFLVRYFDPTAPKYRRKIAEVSRPYRQQIKHDVLPDNIDRELAARVFVEEYLLDWRGVSVKGKSVEFSHANAIRVFSDYPMLFNAVAEEARLAQNFPVSDDDLKN